MDLSCIKTYLNEDNRKIAETRTVNDHMKLAITMPKEKSLLVVFSATTLGRINVKIYGGVVVPSLSADNADSNIRGSPSIRSP